MSVELAVKVAPKAFAQPRKRIRIQGLDLAAVQARLAAAG